MIKQTRKTKTLKKTHPELFWARYALDSAIVRGESSQEIERLRQIVAAEEDL